MSGKGYLTAVKALYGNASTKELAEVVSKSKRRKRVRRRHIEASHQMALVTWAETMDLPLISIPNSGKRSKWAGQREVRLGLTRGVSDLFLAKPSGPYAGFWIEMKSPGNVPRPEQYDWLNKMRANKYMANWYDDWEKAKSAIEDYLNEK